RVWQRRVGRLMALAAGTASVRASLLQRRGLWLKLRHAATATSAPCWTSQHQYATDGVESETKHGSVPVEMQNSEQLHYWRDRFCVKVELGRSDGFWGRR